jgi:hypothetical protein
LQNKELLSISKHAYDICRKQMARANEAVRGEHAHTLPNPKRQKGYRAGRKTARRRERR